MTDKGAVWAQTCHPGKSLFPRKVYFSRGKITVEWIANLLDEFEAQNIPLILVKIVSSANSESSASLFLLRVRVY
jgi:hypothetical protein